MLQQLMCPIEVTSVKPYGQEKIKGSLANQYDLEAKSKDAEVRLHVKNDLPSYTVRGYKLIYNDCNGVEQCIELPDLRPDESIGVVLKNVNHGYNFRVVRNNGTFVLKY